MVKNSERINGFAPINPLKLSGLHQAEYVLNCMIEGQSNESTVNKFEGDEQLVQMWTLFVVHNHWVERNKYGAIALTEKGRHHLEEYKSTSSFKP
ncbi:MAG TPA: hypothetical protein VGE97_06450 [Nitrososphaera sp.]|jgi:hypothetical protein